jgi:circadian clock protein KaiC
MELEFGSDCLHRFISEIGLAKAQQVLGSTGLSSLDSLLGGDGYPDRSTILVVGPPGIGKEALAYWFTYTGLVQGDFCLYVSRIPTRDVLKDAKAFGVDFQQRIPFWIASEGGQVKYDPNDLAGLSYNIKEILKKNSDRRIRVVVDFLSPLLMLNPPESIYKFLSQLLSDAKQYDAVFMATLEDGMHQLQVTTAMQALFDGVLELRVYEEGLSYVPILKVKKMLGVPPLPGYFSFSFTKNGMEISAYAKHDI